MGEGKSKRSAKQGSTELHQVVCKKVLINMSTPVCRVWSNNTGMVKTDQGRVVKFGLKGSSDIIGIYKGLFLGIEVKTGNAVQNIGQKRFEKMIGLMGGIYIIITNQNVEQCLAIVEQAHKETL